MRPSRAGAPFLIVGENIHATRVIRRGSRRAPESKDRPSSIEFVGRDGSELNLPVHPKVSEGADFTAGRVKHVASAIWWGLGGPARESEIARRYISSIVAAEESAGADWLDLNTDEIAPDSPTRAEAMGWLVGVVEEDATIPIAIDSSDSAVAFRGVQASRRPSGRLLLNSASIDRLEVLDLAVRYDSAVVVAASGRSGMPSDALGRVQNAVELVQIAVSLGLSLGDVYIDPLVLPVAVDANSVSFVFEAAQLLRDKYGDAIHVIGGLSNVSFGLPERRLLNDTFIDLAAEAGFDSGILDPVASDLQRVFATDRNEPRYRLARDVLLGRDLFGVAYLAAFRRGELSALS